MTAPRLTNEQLATIHGLTSDNHPDAYVTTAEAHAMADELMHLRALVATEMPCGWPEPMPAKSVALPTMVQWDAVDKYGDGGNGLDPDEAIALGAALIRAGQQAKGGS